MKIQPLKVENAVISGVLELFHCFRINSTQAHEILGQIQASLPLPSTQDIDGTECAKRDVQLTVEFSPWHSINVQSQVTTSVVPNMRSQVPTSVVPVTQESAKL